MYDILIIGTGPAGYVAAIRAAQLGMKVACIEKSSVGGTCLNIGCIPSKSLLDSSLKYHQLLNEYDEHGIEAKDVKFDLEKMMSRKERVVSQLTNGVEALLKSNKIELIEGSAKILSSESVEVATKDKIEVLTTKNIIISTGSRPSDLPDIKIGDHILDSEGALTLKNVPRNLVVIGAGVIGLELGSVWSRLGSKVTVIEAQHEFLPMLDPRISRQVLREFVSQGLDIRLGCEILDVKETDTGLNINFNDKDEARSLDVEKIILAVGRKPNTKDLFEEDLIPLNEKGFIEVDNYCQTPVKSIWAIGDVVRGPMLAHKASEEAIMVVERIHGLNTELNYDHVPNVIYTHPEIAWVGQCERELKELNVDFKSGSFPFLASGRALAAGETVGSVNITADTYTDRILGIQVFGPSASEILQQGLVAMDNDITSEKFSTTVFSHPTVSEALHEATLAMNNKALHIQNRKKRS
ncbi:dihydrolipoyl dehydrogenase [Gammaproteobacteria bacterium]|nr:dihydrolipoyl dehydrogenase [Gammaproteobacteria bacterium]